MRKPILFLLALLLTIPQLTLAAENLFPNPGFEQWGEDVPSDPAWRWSVERSIDDIGDPAFRFIRQSFQIKHSGNASLHLRDDNSGSINNVYRYRMTADELKPLVGQTLRLSAWVKQLRASQPDKVGIGLVFVGEDDKPVKASSFIDTKEETPFTRLTTELSIPANGKFLLICFYTANNFGQTAEAFFDDIELVNVPTLSSAPNPAAQFLLPLLPVPPSWQFRVRGCLRRKGNSGLELIPESKRTNEPAELIWDTIYLNRYLQFSTDKLIFTFETDQKISPTLKILDAGRGFNEVQEGSVETIPEGFRYRWLLAEIPAALACVRLDLPAESDGFTVTAVGFETAGTVQYNHSPEAEAYAAEYGNPLIFISDPWQRPELHNGTFYQDGRQLFLLGPWVYNRAGDWGKPQNNPLNIDHIVYRLPPGKEVFAAMGFNAAQMSAAPCLPGQARFGLGVPKNFREIETNFTEYVKNYQDTYFVTDFAFSYDRVLMADNPAKWEQIKQKCSTWHTFVPVCPESPEGDRYYQELMEGGTKIALKNQLNVGVWELFNESVYGCQCRYNITAFAQEMARKYMSVAAANQVWGTAFADFSELAGQETLQQFKGLWCEWAEFLGTRYAEILTKYSSVVRNIDRRPNVYFTEQLAISSLWSPFMDYRKIADALDLLATEGGWRYGHVRSDMRQLDGMEAVVFNGSVHWYVCDFYAALTRGKKPVINSEHYCWRSEFGLRVPSKRTDMTTSLWNELMHGSSGNFTYVWDKRSGEWKNFAEAKANVLNPSYRSSSLLNPYNWPPEELVGFQMFRDELEPYRDQVLPFPRTKPATVAIYYSQVTAAMSRYASSLNLREQMQRWYSTVLHDHYPLTFVFADDLKTGLPETIKVLLIPAADFETPEVCDAIHAFVARGGKVLVHNNAFRFDSHGNSLASGEFTRAEGTSAEIRRFLADSGATRYVSLVATDGRGSLSGTDAQIIDRGDFKLVFLVGMNDLVCRKVRCQIFTEDAGLFYLTDAICKRLILPERGETWTAAALATGFALLLPPQERVILTLERIRPAGLTTYSVKELVADYAAGLPADETVLAEYHNRINELEDREREGRIYRDVRRENCRPLDISQQVNMNFTDDNANDRKGGGFDQGSKDFRNIPRGQITAAGVPFTLIAPAANDGKSMLILAGQERKYFPLEATGISVNGKAKYLYFLHTMGWGGPKGELTMRYTVHYADGGTVDIPVRSGYEISAWMTAHTVTIPENAKIALEFSNSEGMVNIQAYRWVNPEPEREIHLLDVYSTLSQGIPALIAITLETE